MAEKTAATKLTGDPQDLIRAMPAKGERPAGHSYQASVRARPADVHGKGPKAKFAVIGVTGVFITNAVYDLLFIHLDAGPVTSTTIATVVAAIATYLGNRFWSFRIRQRTGVVREIIVFAC